MTMTASGNDAESSSETIRRRRVYRYYAESNLADSFLSIINHHFKVLVDRESTQMLLGSNENTKRTKEWVTKKEKQALSYSTYRNNVAGVVSGLVSCAMVLRFGRLFRARRLAQQRNSPLLPPPPPSASYSNLDRIAGKRETISSVSSKTAQKNKKQAVKDSDSSRAKSTTATESATTAAETEDAASVQAKLDAQLDWGLAGAVGIFVGVFSSWFFADQNGMHRNVARLPLQPGHSILCQRACPEIVSHYKRVVASKEESFNWSVFARESGEDETAGRADHLLDEMAASMQSMPSDQELWNNPTTPVLNSVTQLVTNCQKRLDFIEEMKRRQRNQTGTDVSQAADPASTYLGVAVADHGKVETNEGDAVSNSTTEAYKSDETKPWWKFW